MGTARNGAEKRRWIVWSVLLLVALPMLYVASVGPAARMAHTGFIPGRAFYTLYRPLRHGLYQTPIGGPLIRYELWWAEDVMPAIVDPVLQ